MRELITVAASFLIVVGLAFYMYASNQKHTIATIENKNIKEVVDKNYDELKKELEQLKAHVRLMDSIYHKQ